LIEIVTEDIKWKLVGDRTTAGKDEFENALNHTANSIAFAERLRLLRLHTFVGIEGSTNE
jgi:hypothetical protein